MRSYDATPDKRGNRRVADLGDLFDVFTGTGARTAEILALRWDDIDLSALPLPTLSIHGTVSLDADGKVFVQDYPKTDDSNRSLMLPQYAVDVLTRRRIKFLLRLGVPVRRWHAEMAAQPAPQLARGARRNAVRRGHASITAEGRRDPPP